ncbi:hypothetical protein B0H21DRAFT_569748 [Amylocystis lapponica]|nr:hypothetical protein B0H21DRAFT_569748 [Amylocystis lapponica]
MLDPNIGCPCLHASAWKEIPINRRFIDAIRSKGRVILRVASVLLPASGLCVGKIHPLWFLKNRPVISFVFWGVGICGSIVLILHRATILLPAVYGLRTGRCLIQLPSELSDRLLTVNLVDLSAITVLFGCSILPLHILVLLRSRVLRCRHQSPGRRETLVSGGLRCSVFVQLKSSEHLELKCPYRQAAS